MTGICKTLAGALIFFTAALTQSLPAATIMDPTFAVLKTKTATYTNVTVTTRAQNYIFIMYQDGLASIKLSDLPDETLQQLGYEAEGEPEAPRTNNIASVAAREITKKVHENLKPLEATWLSRLPWHAKPPKIGSEMLLTLGVIALILHLAFSYCMRLICLKARTEPGILVWLPLLQAIPMFRAAGMSGWWLVGCGVPVLNIIAAVLWSFNIVKARRKHFAWAILLLLPGLSLIAFLYLAFSSGSTPGILAPKFQTRTLQTA